MLRPQSLHTIAKHLKWRAREIYEFQTNPGGGLYTWAWRLRHPSALRRPIAYRRALAAGKAIAAKKTTPSAPLPSATPLPQGITVVIPSRDGAALLDTLLPRIEGADEIIVVDNGSTETWTPPAGVKLLTSKEALSFAAAVNRGIGAARFSHVCLLNNDMEPEPGFLAALRAAYDRVPGLFCATAQIFFPPGQRRQETGKAVIPPPSTNPLDTSFPLTCLEPLEGEDLTYVLYGSGGCSMFDTAKLRAIGGYDEAFVPAYVEDLDLGYRGWLAAGPTVYVAGARTVHHHRSTTSRFFTEDQLKGFVELNYLRFLARAIASPETFGEMWRRAIWRLNLLAGGHTPDPLMIGVMEDATKLIARSPQAERTDEEVLALGSGDHAVFPGRAPGTSKAILIATCYSPYPLSHGGAVRMYNLMRQAARQGYRQVLMCFVDELAAPAPELLDICHEVVFVKRRGSHYRRSTQRPDVVEEFDSPVFRAVMREMIRKHDVALAQLEFTQMAVYAGLAPKSILVEHDVTLDLYQQLVDRGADEDTRTQLARWETFERDAWRRMDAVVVMSERDRRTVGEGAVVLANGVDLERFQPSADAAEPNRILFIGSFNHLPNILALDWFLRAVWPRLQAKATLHVIAGSRHEYYLDFYKDKVTPELNVAGVEIEGFVADVRPAYRRAALVIAPLLASAGTNIKVMEAMAMGKAIVSTPAGVNGLDLAAGADFSLAESPEEFAKAVDTLLADPAMRHAMEVTARRTVEARFSWERIAEEQSKLYERLMR
jgi:glycosyltransferase involved in cell wall biosynthesis/GT2 family glycosyltransferase